MIRRNMKLSNMLSLVSVLVGHHALATEKVVVSDLDTNTPVIESLSHPSCLIPIQQMGLELKDLYNQFDGSDPKYLQRNDAPLEAGQKYTVLDEFRFRYIVGDFNTLEENEAGQKICRGVQEVNPKLDLIPELSDGDQMMRYLSSVGRFETDPLDKPEIVKFRGRNYCIGQTLNLCDAKKVDGGVALKLVAKFITSSKHEVTKSMGKLGIVDGLVDYEKKGYVYYAPVNRIAQRAWDFYRFLDPNVQDLQRGRLYNEEDHQRDLITGGGKGKNRTIFSVGRILMPNFMYFTGLPSPTNPKGFYMDGNGIHEKTTAVGQEMKDFLGAPVSVGCIRLNDFGSKFTRWFIPRGARFFIHYQHENYKTFASDELIEATARK